MIVNILPRRSCLSRGAPGDGSGEQLIAANIDTIFIVTSAGKDINLRRLERYLTVVYSSGASPGILLNKIDLTDNPTSLVEINSCLDCKIFKNYSRLSLKAVSL